MSLVPDLRRRLVWLTILGLVAFALDTLVIGGVTLVLQRAFAAPESVEGHGLLGFVAGLANDLAQQDTAILCAVLFAVLVAHSLLVAHFEGSVSNLRLQAYQSFRERIFARWLTSDPSAAVHRSPGTMVNTVQNEAWEAADALFQYCTLLIATVTATAYVAVMAATSVPLTAIAGVLGLSAIVGLGFLRRRLWQRGQESIAQKEALARHFVSTLTALRTVQAYRGESAAIRKSLDLSTALRQTFESIVRIETAVKPVGDTIGALVLVIVLVVAWQSGLPGAVVVAFVMVLHRTQPRLLAIYQTAARLARSMPSVEKVAEHVSGPNPLPHDTGRSFEGLRQEIRLVGVGYTYPGATGPALTGLDLHIEKGEMIAILGPSGSGKSTLVNLLLRFLEPSAGTITCDGEPLTKSTRSSWLARIAVAGQDVELLDGTVRDNLHLGRAVVSDEELWAALELADAAEIVRGLPAGLDAEVGARGIRLSGGQRQRLCLARALLVPADVLVLDEATNAVDALAELQLYERLRAARPDLTLVVIAHRPAIGRIADRIAVLDRGRVLECGTPSALLARRESVFARLADAGPQGSDGTCGATTPRGERGTR